MTSKLGNILATGGIVYGIFYSMKKNKKFGESAIYVGAFAIAGLLVGNAITKFYEN